MQIYNVPYSFDHEEKIFGGYVSIRQAIYLILGAFVGSISLISLFLPINGIGLLIFKLILGLILCLVSFGYKNIKYTLYNLVYLYMTSIILGEFYII